MKKLLLVTDAWEPQTNGVVTTLQQVVHHLPEFGFEALVAHPGQFRQAPLPSYPEIRISRNPWKLKEILQRERPNACHIATEGPLGLYARSLFGRRSIPFTTSLHTKFPEYVRERIRMPLRLGYAFIRWFHRPAERTLCTTESVRQELLGWGLRNLVVWSRGVDTGRFRPAAQRQRGNGGFRSENGRQEVGGAPGYRRPRLLYVGRIAVEKNVQAFLDMKLDAEKVMVGDGPQRAALQARYPNAQWLGYRKGQALVDEYAAADAFVFPSRTDTFGLVMLEALACGTPVAAYPVTGPKDVVRQGITGWLDEDLNVAVRKALRVSREDCRAYAVANGWPRIARTLADNLAVIDWQNLGER